MDIRVAAVPAGKSWVESSPKDTPRNGPSKAPRHRTSRARRKERSCSGSRAVPPGTMALRSKLRKARAWPAATSTTRNPSRPASTRISVAAKLSSPIAPRLPSSRPPFCWKRAKAPVLSSMWITPARSGLSPMRWNMPPSWSRSAPRSTSSRRCRRPAPTSSRSACPSPIRWRTGRRSRRRACAR